MNENKHPLIALREVSKSYAHMAALSAINLSLQGGEFVAVMGPSGCGKTTLIRILAGFETPDSGVVEMNGRRINEMPPWRRNMPMVWQNLALFPFLNVRENVEFGLKMHGVDGNERRLLSVEWLEKLNIGNLAERPVAGLSGGQLQRVALARTLVMKPQILLLDEPLSALDANMVVHMQGVLVRLQKEIGITFLYVTHSRSEAFAMADRVVVLNHGRIQQIGDPRKIYQAPVNRFVAKFIGANNIFSGEVVEGNDKQLFIRTSDGLFRASNSAGLLKAGGEAEFVVAAADTKISLTDNGGIPCQLVGEEFIGGFVMLHLHSGGGIDIQSQIHVDQLRKLGDLRTKKLYIHWAPDKLHVLSSANQTFSE